jgi:cytochrome c-type biogenesis protein CcmH/NrfF
VTRRLALITLVWLLSAGVGAATAAQRLVTGHAHEVALQAVGIEPLNQVNSPEAENEKATLATLVSTGLDLKQIKARMIADYSEEVLAKPPAHGINLLIYILPPLVLLGGIGVLAYNLPRWRARARVQSDAGAGPTGPPPDQADAERLERELAEFDR